MFTLFDELQRIRDEQKAIRTELEKSRDEQTQQAQAIRDIVTALVNLKETQRLEREKLLLQLENELLKMERRLPPSS